MSLAARVLLRATPCDVVVARCGGDGGAEIPAEKFAELENGTTDQVRPPSRWGMLLGICGEGVSYRDPSGMTVAEVWFVFSAEVSFERLFSFSAIICRCACA
jgi:hypothetical protein